MGLLRKKQAPKPAAEEKTDIEKILKAAVAQYMNVPADSIRIVSWEKHTEEVQTEKTFRHYLNTDGKERNEKLYSKDRWKSI